MLKTRWILSGACAITAMMIGCTEDQSQTNNTTKNNMTPDSSVDMMRCVDGERLDVMLNRCVPIFGGPDMPDMSTPDDMTLKDMADPIDMKDDAIPLDPCDKDFDTFKAATPECGGDDCDDNDPFRNPGREEICDEYDNNCNNMINEGVECEFFANTGDALYKIDPFKNKARKLIPLEIRLQDMDTDPITGVLYGIDAENLYRYEPGIGLTIVGSGLGLSNTGAINGLAIDRDGKVFATGTNRLYEINNDNTSPNYGKGRIVGEMAQDVTSSGDCVINKGNTLFMTSKKRDFPDSLVRIDHTESSASATILGETGYTSIYALTAAWGKLYGLNSDGELILLDDRTGAGTLVGKLADPENPNEFLRFFGAASSPSR